MYANNPNLFSELNAWDIIPRMENGGLLGAGRYIDVDDKKLHKFPAIDIDPNWIYTNPNPELLCMEYHALVKGFGFVPEKCLNCWKIVVAPRSFHELMLLYEIENAMVKEDPAVWCKCGIEVRDFVPRNYGGYFYTRSLGQGKLRHQAVRENVSKHISSDVPVILKRYCTEFELRFGPTDKYKQPEGAKDIEKYFWENTHVMTGARRQPEFVIKHTIANWMLFAWGRGDKTVVLYNNNKPLFRSVVTYHDEAK